MSKTIKYLIIGAVLLVGLLIFTSNRACSLYDENSILKGRDEVLTTQLRSAVDALYEFKNENTVLLTQLKIQEDLLTGVITEATGAAETMVEGLRTVEHLKANAGNDQALISEMTIELAKRDELIEKLFFTVKNQEQRYFTLTETYRITKRELDLAEIALEQYRASIEIKDFRIKGLEKSLKGVRFSSALKTGAGVALAAVIVYGLVAK